MHALLHVGNRLGRPEPEVVVEFSGCRRHDRRLIGKELLWRRHPNRSQCADVSVAHQFRGAMESLERTELAVDPEDALPLRHDFDEAAAFADVSRDRLLQRDVLAGVQGRERHRHVPMVGRRDHHRVDVAPRQQLAEVAVGLTAAVAAHTALLRVGAFDQRPGLIDAPAVDVAHGHDLHARHRHEFRQVEGLRLSACADEAERDAIARSLCPEETRRQDQGCGGAGYSQTGGLQETTAMHGGTD